MGIELDRPVRLQVDFSPPPGVTPAGRPWHSAADAMSWASALGRGLFFLTLGYPPAAGAAVFIRVARSASAAGARVGAILSPGGLPVGRLAGAGLAEASLDVTRFPPGAGLDALLRGFAADVGSLPEAPAAGALFRAERGTMDAIPGVLAAASEAGLAFVELPPPSLVYLKPRVAARRVPGLADYRALRVALEGSALRAGRTEWRPHDLLVSALLERHGGPAGRFDGCQAAGALAFVSSGGGVFPCPALPVPLGSVAELPAGEIWRRREATEVRRKVAARTRACGDCSASDRCRGACPGARLAAGGAWEAPDESCLLHREFLGIPRGGGGR